MLQFKALKHIFTQVSKKIADMNNIRVKRIKKNELRLQQRIY